MTSNQPPKLAKEAISKVSSTFCPAKWKQVTLLLQNGHTQSCHHVKSHKTDPSNLHNSPYKKVIRSFMLNGIRPIECKYCWDVEDISPEDYSDRVYKSSCPWAFNSIDQIKNGAWNEDCAPTYLEVSFSNLCNLSCAYCSPDISSSVQSEYSKHGPYPTSFPYHHNKILEFEQRSTYATSNNPYVDAFWKWFPEISSSLHFLRITGGEPLLDDNFNILLDYIENNPLPNTTLAVNSNLSISSDIFKINILKIKNLLNNNKIKDFILYASIDTIEPDVSYIRHGLDPKLFWDNIYNYLENDELSLTFMTTFNILSIPNFVNFLIRVLSLKEQYHSQKREIILDIIHLNNPAYLSIRIADQNLLDDCFKALSYMKKNTKEDGFSKYEIEKMTRSIHIIEESNKNPTALEKDRTDFFNFINEYDKRKGSSILGTFPKLRQFMQTCSKGNNSNVPVDQTSTLEEYEQILKKFEPYNNTLLDRFSKDSDEYFILQSLIYEFLENSHSFYRYLKLKTDKSLMSSNVLNLEKLIAQSDDTFSIEILNQYKAELYHFFKKYDKKTGTNIFTIHPNLISFWKDCESMTQLELNNFRDDLFSDDVKIKSTAIENLSKYNDTEIILDISKLLLDKNMDIRGQVIECLKRKDLSQELLLQISIYLLDHLPISDQDIKWNIIISIGELNPPALGLINKITSLANQSVELNLLDQLLRKIDSSESLLEDFYLNILSQTRIDYLFKQTALYNLTSFTKLSNKTQKLLTDKITSDQESFKNKVIENIHFQYIENPENRSFYLKLMNIFDSQTNSFHLSNTVDKILESKQQPFITALINDLQEQDLLTPQISAKLKDHLN